MFNLRPLLCCLVFIVLGSFAVIGQSEQPNQKAAMYLSKGRFQDALTELDKDIAREKNLFQNYKFRGMIRRMTGNFRGAFDDYSKALEIDSSDGGIYEQRAFLRMYLGQGTPEILADLDLAISRGVKTARVYAKRGTMRSMMRDTDGAIADLEIAVGLDPGNAGPVLSLANAYDLKGDTAKGILTLENFFLQMENSGIRPEKIESKVVAQTHIKDVPITNLGDSRIGENTVILEGSLRKVSDNVPATKEDLDRMAEEMERKRNIPLAYTTLARLYKKDKQYKKALVAVNRSLELDANDFWALELRGTIKAKLGDLSSGLSDLNRSLEINPNSQSAIYLERGIIYLMMGDKINAQKDFDKFIEAFPNAKKTLEKRIEEANQQISESTVGVAQCDDYLRKVRSCLMTHLPETALVKL